MAAGKSRDFIRFDAELSFVFGRCCSSSDSQLLVTKSAQRVDPRRAPCRNVTRCKRQGDEKDGHGYECRYIGNGKPSRDTIINGT